MGVIEKAYIYTDVLLSHTKIQPQVLYLVGVSAIMLASKVRQLQYLNSVHRLTKTGKELISTIKS